MWRTGGRLRQIAGALRVWGGTMLAGLPVSLLFCMYALCIRRAGDQHVLYTATEEQQSRGRGRHDKPTEKCTHAEEAERANTQTNKRTNGQKKCERSDAKRRAHKSEIAETPHGIPNGQKAKRGCGQGVSLVYRPYPLVKITHHLLLSSSPPIARSDGSGLHCPSVPLPPAHRAIAGAYARPYCCAVLPFFHSPCHAGLTSNIPGIQ